MKIQILNAQDKVFEGVVSMAILPATDGEISLMDYHEPIFVALKAGLIRMAPLARRIGFGRRGAQDRQGEIQEIKPFKIQRGVAHFGRDNTLVILVE